MESNYTFKKAVYRQDFNSGMLIIKIVDDECKQPEYPFYSMMENIIIEMDGSKLRVAFDDIKFERIDPSDPSMFGSEVMLSKEITDKFMIEEDVITRRYSNKTFFGIIIKPFGSFVNSKEICKLKNPKRRTLTTNLWSIDYLITDVNSQTNL